MAKGKPQRKSPSSTSTPAVPAKPAASSRFDMTNAVEMAAAMVGNRARQTAKTPKKESLEFRLLREGVDDPGIQSIEDILDKTSTPAAKRSGGPAEQMVRQTGHHQSNGPDVARTGVPRRTGG